MASVILGESITWWHVLGGAAIICGVLLILRDRENEAKLENETKLEQCVAGVSVVSKDCVSELENGVSEMVIKLNNGVVEAIPLRPTKISKQIDAPCSKPAPHSTGSLLTSAYVPLQRSDHKGVGWKEPIEFYMDSAGCLVSYVLR